MFKSWVISDFDASKTKVLLNIQQHAELEEIRKSMGCALDDKDKRD